MSLDRFLLFASADVRGVGGWYDLQGDFTTLDEARAAAHELFKVEGAGNAPDEFHIVDSDAREVVHHGGMKMGRVDGIYRRFFAEVAGN